MSALKQTALAVGLLALIAAVMLMLMYGLSQAAPALTGRVNDYAGVLTPQQRGQLETQLRSVEASEGKPQLAVLLPKSLEGQDIAQYAGDVARAWRLGRGGKDNGLLLVLAPNERKMRLEVGYGLEGQIPDVRASMILSSMKPYLSRGKEDWFRALSTAVDQITAQLKKD